MVLITPCGWGLLVLAWFTGSRAIRDKSCTLPTWCFLVWPMIMTFVCIAWAEKHRRNPGDPGAEGPGVPLNTIRELLGHEDMKVTMRYAHLAPNNLREAVEALERGSKPVSQNAPVRAAF